MSSIMNIIASETKGKSYKTFKYCLDGIAVPSFDYDDHQEITWERYGETVPPDTSISMKKKADSIQKEKPLFTYFLDGSRRAYKVDDIAYNNRIFPVIAGQVGISCCVRINKQMKKLDFDQRLVIALPKVASQLDWQKKLFFANLKKKINEEDKGLKNNKIEFTDIIPYSTTLMNFYDELVQRLQHQKQSQHSQHLQHPQHLQHLQHPQHLQLKRGAKPL